MVSPSTGQAPRRIEDWRSLYTCDVESGFSALRAAVEALDADDPVWISTLSSEALDVEIARLRQLDPALPLFGVPFAVKDNIDAAGWDTTAACPDYAYRAANDAPAVARLRAAGAVLVGKTNLDQFATGLVGTRSPYGVPANPFDARRVPGGSSSGSAVAVARGLVAFALGTDTAGSGRVPAAFNNIVGLKPTRGRISTLGVVPACASLDCVSIFALTEACAWQALEVAEGFEPDDPWSRRPAERCVPPIRRLAVPQDIDWHGDERQAAAWARAQCAASAAGCRLEAIDFKPFFELAALLYEGPWVAERTAAVGDFLDQHPEAVHPTVAGIISGGRAFSAADFVRAVERRQALLRRIEAVFADFDGLLVPSAPRFPTVDEDTAEPIAVNASLGQFTNFVNLADLCAVALPAGWRSDGLPFGITVIAPAFSEPRLELFARRWRQAMPATLGCSNIPSTAPSRASISRESIEPTAEETVELAVVGAHLRGQPLEAQLTSRGATFVEATTTAACYRLFALPNTAPPKPGLARATTGAAIAVEVWRLSPAALGSLMTEVPPPLGIGSVELADGRWVRGFICEGHALEGAREITGFGGWRAYLAAAKDECANAAIEVGHA